MTRNLKITLGLIVAALIILLFALIYAFFIYEKVPTQELATDFCTCAQSNEVKESTAIRSNDNFKYRIKLDDCVGKKFAAHSEGLTEEEKNDFLDQIQEIIFQQCPEAVNNVFAPIPVHRRFVRIDTIASAPSLEPTLD